MKENALGHGERLGLKTHKAIGHLQIPGSARAMALAFSFATLAR